MRQDIYVTCISYLCVPHYFPNNASVTVHDYFAVTFNNLYERESVRTSVEL